MLKKLLRNGKQNKQSNVKELFGNTQALTKENKVRLAGVGLLALGCLSEVTACKYLPNKQHPKRKAWEFANFLVIASSIYGFTSAKMLAS